MKRYLESLGLDSCLIDLYLRTILRIALFSFYVILAFFHWEIALTLFLIDFFFNLFRNMYALRNVNDEYLLTYLRVHYNKQMDRFKQREIK